MRLVRLFREGDEAMKKRIVSLLLAISALMPFAGCRSDIPNETEAQSTASPETEPMVTDIVLNPDGAKFIIVRPEKADKDIISQATALRSKLIAYFDGDRDVIGISDDWVKLEEEADNDAYEILIGLTNRPESEEEKNALPGYLDWSVTVRGNKICVFAHEAERLAQAVEYFLGNLKFENGKLSYCGGDHLNTYDYPIKDLTFCGLPARNYVIVIPAKASETEEKIAQSLCSYLAEKAGVLLDIVDDSSPAADAEILIGAVDRPETANIKKEGYKLMTEGKKIIISAASSAYYYGAKDLFIEKIESEGKIAEGTEIEAVDSAMDFFLKDNYASGLIGDEVNLAVQAMLSCLEYYNDRMVYGTKNLGERWVYSNRGTYAAQTGYFDDMLTSSKKGGNCASPVNWALCDMGIVPKNDRFYGGSTGNFASYSGDAREYLAPYCEIIDMYDDPVTFKELYKAGKVQAGDIFLCKHHTFVYRGDQTFYAAGHDGAWHTEADAPTEDERKAVFDNWVLAFDEVAETGNKVSGKYNTNYNYKVYYIVRLKDDVIPEYYRNKEGKVVKNPMIAE